MDERAELVGMIEIAMRAGVRRAVVSVWRARYPDFPAPVAELAIGPVFVWAPVQAWLEDTGRRSDAGWTKDQIRPKEAFPQHLRRGQ
jgi:hypothetical protein